MSGHGRACGLPIVFEDVEIRAGDIAILDGVSVTIHAGAPTVLIGPNGSGKTTFLRAAMGLAAPARGRISWGDGVSEPPVRRAILFQRPVMLRRSAAGNIAYALAAAGVARVLRRERISELLALVGLAEFADRPARALSGGEQQRLALARALAGDPEILFLDEPTASLDPSATRAIEDVVRATAARGIKIVMATHDLGEARRVSGQIVFMHRGRTIETGETPAFFADPITSEARKFIAGDLLE